jgi:hypothetical protein
MSQSNRRTDRNATFPSQDDLANMAIGSACGLALGLFLCALARGAEVPPLCGMDPTIALGTASTPVICQTPAQ